MQLKKLQLLGFKTFADKTEILIDSGMTAIVGPNGSGKSNIVDALLWVLGEQNPRLMRGTTSQDVIFSGTDKRKPLGMAEVRLTVDNSDGALAIKFSEVTITRRIYRSGESQYMINGAACRLKDIVELFMDTGVGKGAYSFVSQQEIDAVLSAKPEERRELFEEAAGIKKYRVKKREALRKLENAEINLNRVRDILLELEAQRDPLEKQAVAARRYLLLQERLGEIEVGLLVAELQKGDYELISSRREKQSDEEAQLRFDAELTVMERNSLETGERLALAENEVEIARQARENAFTQAERAESRLALMLERGASALKSKSQITSEIAEITERTHRIRSDIEALQIVQADTESVESRLHDEWASQKASLRELEIAVKASLEQTETRRRERIRAERERADRESLFSSTQERHSDVSKRYQELEQHLSTLNSALTEVENKTCESKEALLKKAAERGYLDVEIAELEANRQHKRAELAALRAAIETARRAYAEHSSRLATLKELQENHEGFYQGVRNLLNAVKSRQINGHFRAVVDLISVDEPYRIAIEVALGGSLQDVVTETEAEAKSAIQWLKQHHAGRATFLAIPLLRTGQKLQPSDSNRETVQNGMDLVKFLPQYEPVIRLLLGRSLVVTDMDSAINCSRRQSGWNKIVTLGGELLSPGGALTGGSLQGKGTHLVGRKGEIDDLRSSAPKLKADVEEKVQQQSEIERGLLEIEVNRSALDRLHSTILSASVMLESEIASYDRELIRLKREILDHESSLKTLNLQMDVLAEETKRLKMAIESDIEADVSAEDNLTELGRETNSLAEERDSSRSAAIALEVEVSRLREKRDGIAREIASNRAALSTLEQQLRQKTSQSIQADSEGTDASAERERLEISVVELRKNQASIEANLQIAQQIRQTLLNENFTLNSGIKETMNLRSEVTKSLHGVELRIARLEVQISQISERLLEEYAITREEALRRPEDTTIDRNTAMEVGRLRRELRGMGQVNTGAAEEFERLTERYEFLTSQRADLEKARESLLTTIGEIDENTRGVFGETFDKVSVEFDKLFSRLFGGGTTKLVLTTPDDILETGIEIIAQPPGKKPQHLSLLSGGERALTATALLFAFLAVKPSPFVLLDEVDAPLDGANVEKYTSLIREFSERSQFLLITHNPTTMEAAPTWYGVTMREQGVSSILSYRVPEESIRSEPEQQVVLN